MAPHQHLPSCQAPSPLRQPICRKKGFSLPVHAPLSLRLSLTGSEQVSRPLLDQSLARGLAYANKPEPGSGPTRAQPEKGV